ncbi:MAG: tRNA (adenine(22)-N(1))-methyltransferase TrmK [Lachnospiraceae bacterium]|nr:tRNA (adenine(22)-N(1))-methyltransferase TrmK [Lachnospiraceae bacterium]
MGHKLNLSVRLRAVASYAVSGLPLADIGTDHGYVPIYLVDRGVIPSAIAADVRTGPLERAAEHIREYGLEEKIKVRLSDGLKNIRPGEVSQVLIAGMGGGLMARILAEGQNVLHEDGFCRLILSPQSEVRLVREELAKSGFQITEEHMVKDEGKFYFIIIGEPGDCDYSTEEDFLFGKRLVENRDEVFLEYLEEKRRKDEEILTVLRKRLETGEEDEKILSRIAEIEEEKRRILVLYSLAGGEKETMVKRISFTDEDRRMTSVEVVVEDFEDDDMGNTDGGEAERLYRDFFVSEEETGIYAEHPVLKEPEVAYGHRKVSGEYTIEDYYRLPEGVRIELIDGVFYYMGAPIATHQIIAHKLAMAFSLYLEKKNGKCEVLPGADVQLDRDDWTMLQPDIVVVYDRDKIRNQIYGNPDLVVEVLSRSTRKRDRTIKLHKYQKAGVREYWMVDPKKKMVEVYIFPDLEMATLPRVYKFEDRIPVGIFDGECEVDFGKIYHSIEDLMERENN